MSDTVTGRWHPDPPPPGSSPLVVAVSPGQPSTVPVAAADLAAALGTGLVCVWSDPSRVVTGHRADGTPVTEPVDPDTQDPDADRVAELEAQIAAAVAPRGVSWRLVIAAGDPARALAAAGEAVGARFIVVGSRPAGVTGWMHEVIGGSVAGRLSHTQPRPVLIVPTHR